MKWYTALLLKLASQFMVCQNYKICLYSLRKAIYFQINATLTAKYCSSYFPSKWYCWIMLAVSARVMDQRWKIENKCYKLWDTIPYAYNIYISFIWWRNGRKSLLNWITRMKPSITVDFKKCIIETHCHSSRLNTDHIWMKQWYEIISHSCMLTHGSVRTKRRASNVNCAALSGCINKPILFFPFSYKNLNDLLYAC